MKIPKTFRLSEEAVAVLDAQENATAFLEDQILNVQLKVKALAPTPSHLTEGRVSYLLSQQTDEIIKALKNIALPTANKVSTPLEKNTVKVPPTTTTRNKSDIRAEITLLEEERREELQYIQDPESTAEIHKKYQSTIDGLWAEFHSL